MNSAQRINAILHHLYPHDAANMRDRLQKLMVEFSRKNPNARQRQYTFSEKDSVLISYADQILSSKHSPLAALNQFLLDYIGDSISTVHLLPFFPYSSDDGFSVIDYTQVNPEVGTWADISRLGEHYHLMFDFVLNHISRSSEWFQEYIAGNPMFANFFITVNPDTDLSSVVRPRALPLLTAVDTAMGTRHLWTTFSADQIDLNFANPEVALEMIKVLLTYVEQGAVIIRMDAIAYLWKEIGTKSIHLPQTHLFVKLLRAILDEVSPYVVLITETNVPHEENIAYFGDPIYTPEFRSKSIRSDEAQMVYQFSLAPLVLHTFLHGDCTALQQWAASLMMPVGNNTYFNFLASHDGIGLRPAEGLLNADDIQALAKHTLAHGGQVSYRTNVDGSKSPYELNITLFDFLNDSNTPDSKQGINRFMASQAIMLSLAGLPGIYFHSLLGSSNCHKCYQKTERARSLNREKFSFEDIQNNLANQDSRAALVLDKYRALLDIRRKTAALSPYADQEIIATVPEVFCVLRTNANTQHHLLALINISDQPAAFDLKLGIESQAASRQWRDLITQSIFPTKADKLHIEMVPYQVLWLQPE